ncbi:MAG: N-acetylmuramoyl-L-alanine amidase, partial [Myxococcota bacterium]
CRPAGEAARAPGASAVAGAEVAAVETAPPPVWPAAGAPLRVLPARPARGTLLLDAGHGADGNTGNTNGRCEAEQDVMKRVTDGVAERLVARGLAVRRTRPDAALVPYPTRLRASRDATWFVSFHSDARAGEGMHRDPDTGCWVNTGATGFSVLWSDEGDAALVAKRRALARAVARRLAEAGLPPYLGTDYGGLYDGDEVPGVFVDRHAPKQRIMLLRRPVVPSILVETHQAWDRDEVARWEEPGTWDAVAGALAAALSDVEAE